MTERRDSQGRPTQRQMQILRLIAQGHANKAIARQLGITLNTVKCHNYRMFTRLGVTTRTGAVVLAYRNGWIA